MRFLCLPLLAAAAIATFAQAAPVEVEVSAYDNFSKVIVSGQEAYLGQIVLEYEGRSAMSFCAEFPTPFESKRLSYTQGPLTELAGKQGGINQDQAAALGSMFRHFNSNAEAAALISSTNQDRVAVIGMPALDRHQAAAVQLLVWEIVHDFDGTDPETIDLYSGAISVEDRLPRRVETIFGQLKSQATGGSGFAPEYLLLAGLLAAAPLTRRLL